MNRAVSLSFNQMVDCLPTLDSVFGSLADPIRRDILRRISTVELTVNELAEPYEVSLAAVSKHLKVLEKAQLIVKRRRGKHQMVSLAPAAFANANEYLDFYKTLANSRLDSLERFLDEEQSNAES